MIIFTPLTGSATTPGSPLSTGPVSYLLELDDVKILLDLGGNDPRRTSEEGYDATYEQRIKECVSGVIACTQTYCRADSHERDDRLSPTIDLLLLSHSPTSYTSLYPYARTHWGLKCPVYGTQPTVEIGRLGCLEEGVGWRNEIDVDARRGTEMEVAGTGQAVHDGERRVKGPFVCTAEEINEAFDHVKAVRYSQPIHLSGKSISLSSLPECRFKRAAPY